jgi:hypothetical protein
MKIERKSIEGYIADVNRRVDRIETGSKPMTGMSDTFSDSFIIGAGQWERDLSFNLIWQDPNIQSNPAGQPHFTIYVDTADNELFAWPYGGSLSAGQLNMQFDWFYSWEGLQTFPNRTRATFAIRNNDSTSHTYHFRGSFIYLAGTSSGQL